MSDPFVVFLDEPTSGLDSLTAYIIVSYLQKLAHQHNKTVIMTIHQPSSELFFLFDRLFLLAEGVAEAGEVASRLALLKEKERELIESADVEFRFHSGIPSNN